MKTKGLVLAMLLIFGFASVAAAECAWVVWEKRQWEEAGVLTARLGKPFWFLRGAYTTYENCHAARDEKFRLGADLERKVEGNKQFEETTKETLLTFTRGAQTKYILQYMCLPDTIDPREKKE